MTFFEMINGFAFLLLQVSQKPQKDLKMTISQEILCFSASVLHFCCTSLCTITNMSWRMTTKYVI